MADSSLIIASVISILGLIATLWGLYTAHQNKRLRNIYVYLTHITLAIANLLLLILVYIETAYFQLLAGIMVVWVATC
jgi:ABC-type dipeptide/oligopeptide/nickel transport system permease subunit